MLRKNTHEGMIFLRGPELFSVSQLGVLVVAAIVRLWALQDRQDNLLREGPFAVPGAAAGARDRSRASALQGIPLRGAAQRQ